MRSIVVSALAVASCAIASCTTSSSPPAPSVADAAVGDGASTAPTDATRADRASPAGDAATCKLVKPYATRDVDCNVCAERACCALINDCYENPDCDDGYVNCLLACVLLPDDAGADGGDAGVAQCTAQCAAEYPTGSAQYDALSTCVDAECASDCAD